MKCQSCDFPTSVEAPVANSDTLGNTVRRGLYVRRGWCTSVKSQHGESWQSVAPLFAVCAVEG